MKFLVLVSADGKRVPYRSMVYIRHQLFTLKVVCILSPDLIQIAQRDRCRGSHLNPNICSKIRR